MAFVAETIIRMPPVARHPGTDGQMTKDAWGREFVYECPGRDGDFDLFSYGADGREGGEGPDSDITNRE